MIELTGFQRDLLYALAGLKRPSGTDIQEALEDYYGSTVISARVYQNLDRLANKGYAEKGESDSRRNHYELTSAGTKAITLRRAWEDDHLDSDITEERI